jgi:hypothetical protein
MIRPPSNQKQYDAVFSGDEAFVQPPDAPADDATPEQLEKYQGEIEEYQHKWQVARETVDGYRALMLEGAGEPTFFTMRPLTADQFALLVDMRRGGMGGNEVNILAFRAALISVRNFPKAEIKRVMHKKLGDIATTSFFDKAKLPAGLSTSIGVELGNLAISKAAGLSPK